MHKDLAIELAILAGLVFCILLFVPPLIYPWAYGLSNAILPLIGFAGLLFCSIFQIRRLINKGKITHAIAFIIILLVTIIISSIIFWILYRPGLI